MATEFEPLTSSSADEAYECAGRAPSRLLLAAIRHESQQQPVAVPSLSMTTCTVPPDVFVIATWPLALGRTRIRLVVAWVGVIDTAGPVGDVPAV
jgi:hypothetical protein